MAPYPRYAIYYAPPAGTALDEFGARLLGYDAWTGTDLAFPEQVAQMVADWIDVSSDPRKYGFHATLKAPFALAMDRREDGLLAACDTFAATPRPLPVITPVVDAISGFIAIVPAGPVSELQRLASDCVTDFDHFRAPLTDDERARRNPAALSPRQGDYLDRWGYPYVLEEFRFHMTLTGRLGAARREPIVAMLRGRFAELHLDHLAIDRIALFRQDDESARFRIIGDWPLRQHDQPAA